MNVNQMTLEEKVGQMFMVGVQNEQHLEKILKSYFVGGIIHFSRNGTSAKEAHAFFSTAKKLSPLPLFTTIDQEGGIVTRIKTGVTPISGQMAIAATQEVRHAKSLSQLMARELALLGINMNLAPVVDVNVNPKNPVINVRSFGEAPQLVSDYASASLQGYKNEKMLAVAKHFPGHGDTHIDSHHALPVVDHDLKRIHDVELMPFIKMIEEEVPGMMISHVMFTTLDDQLPATLSYKVITELLRETLGFKGLILTDCMEMKAVSQQYGPGTAAVKSVLAGADVLLYSSDLNIQKQAIEGVVAAVKDGRITEERIHRSVQRIIDYKKAYGVHNDLSAYEDIEHLLVQNDAMTYTRKVALNSITKIGLLDIIRNQNDPILIFDSDTLRKWFKHGICYSDNSSKAIEVISGSDKVFIFYKKVDDLIGLPLDPNKTVLISVGSPYEQVENMTTLFGYELSDLSIGAIKQVLQGEQPKGVLPVSEVL